MFLISDVPIWQGIRMKCSSQTWSIVIGYCFYKATYVSLFKNKTRNQCKWDFFFFLPPPRADGSERSNATFLKCCSKSQQHTTNLGTYCSGTVVGHSSRHTPEKYNHKSTSSAPCSALPNPPNRNRKGSKRKKNKKQPPSIFPISQELRAEPT